MRTSYVMVTAATAPELAQAVNDYLLNDWRLFGGPCAGTRDGANGGEIWLFQALVRETAQ